MRLFNKLISPSTTPSYFKQKQQEVQEPFAMNTAFGPPNYILKLPYTQIFRADQWKANVLFMKVFKRMNIE